MALTGAEYILKKISLLGVRTIFGIPGGHIDPLFVAAANSEVEAVINTHELSSGYMADGYSRASQKIGVLIGISGPGSNNMVTAVNTARVEKVPLLVITGGMPLNLSVVPGFQCGNEFGTRDDAIFKPITKYSKRLSNIRNLAMSLEEAVNIALSPPFGPVHLIVPYDIFNATTELQPQAVNFDELKYWKSNHSGSTVNRIAKLLSSDKKVVFWIGDTLNRKEQAADILALAEQFHIPVATSFSAKGVIPEGHELALGNFGYAGSQLSKGIFLSDEPDVIIGFDIEQNERNSLNWNPDLFGRKKILLINYPGCFTDEQFGESVNDNPFYILKSLRKLLATETYDTSDRKQWLNSLKQQFDVGLPPLATPKTGEIEPGRLIQLMQQKLPKDSILFVDSGAHRVFAGFHWKSPLPESYYSASVVAPLGWALAAGLGAAFGRKEPVLVFTGDGCMQMHGIELKTAVKHNKAILVVINNNSAFGAVYNRYKKASRKAADMVSITEIDWTLFAKSFGAKVFDIYTEAEFSKHILDFLTDKKLTILNVRTPVSPYIHDISLAKSAYA
jgi:acetolactate synthase-1/2/3 large subunit